MMCEMPVDVFGSVVRTHGVKQIQNTLCLTPSTLECGSYICTD